MLLRLRKLIGIVFLFGLFGCSNPDPNSQIDEGLISGNSYRSEEIGWSMDVPVGWKLLSRKQVDRFEKKGADLLSETVGGEIEFEGLKNLLHFQKDRFNMFQSTSEPIELEYEGEWEQSNEDLKQVLLRTYINQGIHTEVSETRKEEIGGVLFEVYDFTLFAPDGEVVIEQTMYSTHRNGYDFGVNLTYNSDEARDAMLDVWRRSKFEKAESSAMEDI